MKYDEFIRAERENRSKRRKPRHIESNTQCACVTWFRLQYPEYIIFSVPNGGSRNKIEASTLKKEGALAGVSDLIIVADRSVMFVEMKSEKGRQQESQKKFQQRVERLGHTYRVCRSFPDFRMTVERWLKDKFGMYIEEDHE